MVNVENYSDVDWAIKYDEWVAPTTPITWESEIADKLLDLWNGMEISLHLNKFSCVIKYQYSYSHKTPMFVLEMPLGKMFHMDRQHIFLPPYFTITIT